MKITKEIETLYGNQSESDNNFTKKARLLQSIWRVEQGLDKGVGPTKNSIDKKTGIPTYYGNMLADGNTSGKNFFFNETFEYAQKRVKEKKKDETIDDFRLFNNLLSSMPMAFNLFHPLMMIKEKYPEQLNKMIKDAFPLLPIYKIKEIDLEFIPTPIEKFTNDKSAMDAFIKFGDKDGSEYMISIETKYTDNLGINTVNDKKLLEQIKIAKELHLFTDEAIEKLEHNEIKLTQIYRNFLLTEKYRVVKGVKDSYSIIIAPDKHPTTKNEIDSLNKYLREIYKDNKIKKYSLEDFVNALRKNCPDDYIKWLDWFYDRYLDFGKTERLNVKY